MWTEKYETIPILGVELNCGKTINPAVVKTDHIF